MSEIKISDNLVYSESQEWIQQDSDITALGITDFAQTDS